MRQSRSLDLAPSFLSELPKENFPALHIDLKQFIQSIEAKLADGRPYHHIDLIGDYIEELTQHPSTLWFVCELDLTLATNIPFQADRNANDLHQALRLSDRSRSILDQYVPVALLEGRHIELLFLLADIQANHLRACLCYVENALGSSKSDLSEDSIERFSCFARLKVKFKLLGHCFARLQFFLYQAKNSTLQQSPFDIDDVFYRSKPETVADARLRISAGLWVSSLYYFLSDVQDDALACIYQLQRLLPESVTIVLPNLINHTTISTSKCASADEC